MNKLVVYAILAHLLYCIVMDKNILFDGRLIRPLSIEKEDGSGYCWNISGYSPEATGEQHLFINFRTNNHTLEFAQ